MSRYRLADLLAVWSVQESCIQWCTDHELLCIEVVCENCNGPCAWTKDARERRLGVALPSEGMPEKTVDTRRFHFREQQVAYVHDFTSDLLVVPGLDNRTDH